MRLLIFCIFVGIHLGLLGQSQQGRDRTPKYSNEFLQLGVGARTFGLANSAVAITSDVTSGYWNPAGLLDLDGAQGMLMHSSYFGGLANYDYGAYATTLDEKSAMSVSIIRFSVDDIPDTRFLFDANGSINYDNIRLFAAADYGVFGSYARRLDILEGLDVGASVKVIHRKVGDFSKSWGFGVDVGAKKRVNDWLLGLMARDILGTFNAWSHNVDELEDVYALTGNSLPGSSVEITLPRLIFGVARQVKVGDQFTILGTIDLDFTFDGRRNTLISTKLTSIDPHGGLECGFRDLAFLRLGVGQFQKTERFNEGTYWTFQPTAGVGININQIHLDYALTDALNQAEGLYSHVFSIIIDFNASE